MRARVLDTAEALLRRHGLDKLNVVDVARAMNMSHGNVYRHFPSKAVLRAAVIHRWLGNVSDQMQAVAATHAPADQRLIEWLKTLAIIKQRKVKDDAELLAAAVKVVGDMPEVQDQHADALTAQLRGILEAGMADGTLPGVKDAPSTSIAILNATTRFHHPVMVAMGGGPSNQMQGLDGVISLIMSGLKCTCGP